LVVQARALDRWSDGSVRWALLDFTADVHEDAVWRVVVAPDLQAPQDDRVIRVTEGSDVLMVDTAAAAFAIDPARAFPLARVTRGGADVIADAPQACRVVARSSRGASRRARALRRSNRVRCPWSLNTRFKLYECHAICAPSGE
jgi:hypothetical protein